MADTHGKPQIPKHMPYFIVGTLQEAASVEAHQYAAIAASECDPANVALQASQQDDVCTAVVVLDGDAAQEWCEAFEAAGAPCRAVVGERRQEYAAALATGGDGLFELLRQDYADAWDAREADRLKAEEKVLNAAHVYDTMNVAFDIAAGMADRQPIPTGIGILDAATGGGLPEGGLTVIGAGSSSGKTTLCVQIADHMAASGMPVLFVTVEQSRHEIVAKSLSRMMRLSKDRYGGYHVASMGHILSTEKRRAWDSDKTEAFNACCATYAQKIAPHMHIMEMDGQPTVDDIRKAVDAVAKVDAPQYSGRDFMGCDDYSPKPVVIIDYLQLLGAKDERMTDRKAVDVNVMELRQMARQLNTAVVVISSINRQSYNEGAGMEAFKESGAIEFSADLALMLQPRGWSDRVKAKSDKEARDKAREALAEYKDKASREAEIVILKNRSGAVPSKPVPLLFDAMCNLFTEDASAASEGKGAGRVVL